MKFSTFPLAGGQDYVFLSNFHGNSISRSGGHTAKQLNWVQKHKVLSGLNQLVGIVCEMEELLQVVLPPLQGAFYLTVDKLAEVLLSTVSIHQSNCRA